MSEVFRCEDKDTLVAYLYGEVEPDVRREVERHLRTCASCSREAEALHQVRQDLQLWMPPEPELGFSIVQQPSSAQGSVLRPRRWAVLHELPAWAQVAAAALFIAAGVGLANVQVRSTGEGVVVTTGWMAAEPVAAPIAAARDGDWRRELVALEQNLRAEMALHQNAVRAAVTTAAPVATAGSPLGTAAVLSRVQAMIEESEERQRQEMALRFIQAERTWNVRRQADLSTINQAFGNLQGRTLAVQVGQQEMMNQFRLQRVTAPQPNQ